MGGVADEFLEGNQYREFCEELDTVTYYIYFSNRLSLELFDLDKLHKSLTDKISRQLDAYGVRHKVTFVDGGGGGLDTLWEIVQRFLDTKELIAFALSLFSYAKTAYLHFVNNTVNNLKPAIDVHLYIEADKKIDRLKASDSNYIVSRRLANLFVVANGVLDTISKDLNGFNFNVSVAAQINSQHSSVSFNLPKKPNSEHKINRMLQIIKDLRLRKNYFSTYSFSPLGFVKREDTELVSIDGSLEAKDAGKYYLLISTYILSDYFSKK